jgi:cbb3-type cytochrome oxidase subunit 3
MLLAQTYEDHMRAAQFYEILGWILGGLAFAVLIGGVIYSELRRKRRKQKDQESRTK